MKLDSFNAQRAENTQCLLQLLQLWEKNGYFDEMTIQQLQNPAVGLGQYQVSLTSLLPYRCASPRDITGG